MVQGLFGKLDAWIIKMFPACMEPKLYAVFTEGLPWVFNLRQLTIEQLLFFFFQGLV
jgi:hypothetical protein